MLLGAGISMASGIKTGWGIVQDLVSKVAVLDDPDNPDTAAEAADDPEGWWQEQFGKQLGYSGLLAEAAPTQAARQALLAGYFEPEDGDDTGKKPTDAHRAIARLVKRGTIRVILTTNFDRLMERALEEVGVSRQVVRDHQIDSMKPLAHRAAVFARSRSSSCTATTPTWSSATRWMSWRTTRGRSRLCWSEYWTSTG